MNCQMSKTKRPLQRKSMGNISSTKIQDGENIPVAQSGAPRARPRDGRFQSQARIIKLAGGSQAYKCPETENPQDLAPTMRARRQHGSRRVYSMRRRQREFNSWRFQYHRLFANRGLFSRLTFFDAVKPRHSIRYLDIGEDCETIAICQGGQQAPVL